MVSPELQPLDVDAALAEWRAQYEMTPSQLTLTRDLFDRKMSRPVGRIQLTPAERDIVAAEADGEAGFE